MSDEKYTQQEKDNIAVVHRWLELYNNDAERLVREIYAPDTVVRTMGAGTYSGTDHFLRIERDVLKAAPRRSFRLNHIHADGNTCIVEVTLLNPDDKRFGEKVRTAHGRDHGNRERPDQAGPQLPQHRFGYPLWPGLEEADPNKPA